MKVLIIALCSLLISVNAIGKKDNNEDQIKVMIKDFYNSFKTANFDKINIHYTKSYFKSKEEIKDFKDSLQSAKKQRFKYTIKEIHVFKKSSNVAYARYTLIDSKNKLHDNKERWFYLIKLNNKWKIDDQLDHFNPYSKDK